MDPDTGGPKTCGSGGSGIGSGTSRKTHCFLRFHSWVNNERTKISDGGYRYLCERVDLDHGGVLAEEEVVQVEQNLRHLVLLGRADAQLHSHALNISK
jgi:hypothetical protein